MSDDFRAFWAVIPATVLEDMSIPANAKILYGVISTLTKRKGYCYARNAQLAEAMHCSEDVIKRWVSALAEAGHITVQIEPDRKIGGKRRYIFPALPKPPDLSVSDDNGDECPGTYGDKCPGTYGDKNPGVGGQTSRSSNNKKKKEKEKEKARENRAQIDQYFEQVFVEYPQVFAALSLMLDARAEAGNPMPSLTAAKTLHRKLMRVADDGDGFNPYLAESCLLYSAEKGYPSVYPPKSDEIEAARAQLRQFKEKVAGYHNASNTAVDLEGLVFV